MARVFICEPNDDLRALFELFLARLGHVPVVCDRPLVDEELRDVDAVLVEPASPTAAAVVDATRRAPRSIPVICASIYPNTNERRPPGCSEYLVKPFSVADLGRALDAVLRGAALPAPAAAGADAALDRRSTSFDAHRVAVDGGGRDHAYPGTVMATFPRACVVPR